MSKVIKCRECKGTGKISIRQPLEKKTIIDECGFCHGDGEMKVFRFVVPLQTEFVRFHAIDDNGNEIVLGNSG